MILSGFEEHLMDSSDKEEEYGPDKKLFIIENYDIGKYTKQELELKFIWWEYEDSPMTYETKSFLDTDDAMF